MIPTADQWAEKSLDELSLLGDSEFDSFVHQILETGKQTSFGSLPFSSLFEAINLIKTKQTNQELLKADFSFASTPDLARLLTELSQKGSIFPDWADWQQIERAEYLFLESGILTGVLFFCASLPEVYVVSSIANVLHATGHLEKATEARIRSTATMILTILLPGGLNSPSGNGLVQTIKVRLIHSIIRALLVMPNKPQAVSDRPPVSMYEALFNLNWNKAQDGQPVNQEEMAYTLLTFGYIFLRSLRRLGLRYCKADELAYLHFWNVVGFALGIDQRLMAHNMKDAKRLFEILQVRAQQSVRYQGHSKTLGLALVSAMEKSIPSRGMKPIASLIMRFLTSSKTAMDLGLDQRHGYVTRTLFLTLEVLFRAIDRLTQVINPRFSINRFFVRIVGYQLLSKVLADPTQPLELPLPIRRQINVMLHDWSYDSNAPAWLNRIEDYFTTKGSWSDKIGV